MMKIKYNKTKQQLLYEADKLFWLLLNMKEIGKIISKSLLFNTEMKYIKNQLDNERKNVL